MAGGRESSLAACDVWGGLVLAARGVWGGLVALLPVMYGAGSRDVWGWLVRSRVPARRGRTGVRAPPQGGIEAGRQMPWCECPSPRGHRSPTPHSCPLCTHTSVVPPSMQPLRKGLHPQQLRIHNGGQNPREVGKLRGRGGSGSSQKCADERSLRSTLRARLGEAVCVRGMTPRHCPPPHLPRRCHEPAPVARQTVLRGGRAAALAAPLAGEPAQPPGPTRRHVVHNPP